MFVMMSLCELCLQEFDRQASATVKRMFDEIDGMLFEGIPFNGKWWHFYLKSLTKPCLNSSYKTHPFTVLKAHCLSNSPFGDLGVWDGHQM